MNTNGLKPGIHFMQGERLIKSVSLFGNEGWEPLFGSADGRTQSAEELLASVGWVFTAINKRRQNIQSIKMGWQRKDGEEGEPPFNFPLLEQTTGRIDAAIQTLGNCYLHKQRQGSRFIGVRWLDPAAITPDSQSLTGDGYQQYIYQTTTGPKKLPAEDIIRIYDPLFREHDAGPTASAAISLAAQVLLGMSETADTFFETNGLPIMAVIVPEGTSEHDTETIRDRFERVFRRRRNRDGNKTIGLKGDVQIVKISLAPKDLAMAPLSEDKRTEIAAAYDMTPAILWDSTNSNQASDKWQQFITALGVRLQLIATTINEDEDVQASGWEMYVNVESHWAMKTDESIRALGVTRYAQVLTPKAALYLMGITREDFPKEWPDEDVFFESIQRSSVPETGDDEAEADTGDMKAAEMARLKRYVKKGKHKKRPFHSDILTPDEIAGVANGQDAPFPFESYP